METPFFYIDNFIFYLRTEKRYSEHTIIAYRKDLEQFFERLPESIQLMSIKAVDIREWISDLYDTEITKRSINRKISTLKTFFKWIQKEGIITVNPASSISGLKTEKRLPEFVKESDLSKAEMTNFFDDSFEGVRNILIIEIFYQTGIRLTELINLKTNSVNIDSIKVLGKRNKERIVPISTDLNELIVKYNQYKHQFGIQGETFFLQKNSNKLYPKLVYRIINNYLGYTTKLKKRSPHVLRHTFATHMLNNGAGIETLKNLLGHASLSATQVYTHNSFSQLTNIYSLAHPRGHKKQ